MECLRLRVKDVDLSYRQVLVRDGKGQKDRVRAAVKFRTGAHTLLQLARRGLDRVLQSSD